MDAVRSEFINKEPVNWCVSSEVSPNFVEPVTPKLITFLLTTSKLKALALTVPEMSKVPVNANKFVEESNVKFSEPVN